MIIWKNRTSRRTAMVNNDLPPLIKNLFALLEAHRPIFSLRLSGSGSGRGGKRRR